jgi:hypothetical protein
MEFPDFEDIRDHIDPEYHHRLKSMNTYYDTLRKEAPQLKSTLREFDSCWILKTQSLVDAAFITGFLVGRRLGGDMVEYSGTRDEEE